MTGVQTCALPIYLLEIETIKAFAPYFAAFMTLAIYLTGRRIDRKEKNKTEKSRDDAQDKRFDVIEKSVNETADNLARIINIVDNVQITNSRIENDVKELANIHKYENYHKKLNAEIRNTVIKLLSTQRVQNSEVKQMFVTAVSRFKNVISDILQSDFQNLCIENISELLTIESKHVYTQLNFKAFELPNVDFFISEIKNKVIEPKFRVFAVELISVAENYENGKRRELFRSMVLALVANIVNETLIVYDSHKKNNGYVN